MKSLFLGELFGIKLELHWSFLIIGFSVLLLFGFTQPANLASIVMLFFLLFLSVFLHELSHSVVSLQRGIRVEKIVLLPIGGASLTDSIPENPKDEFLIAIAGPALNFIVVIAILLMVSLFPLPFPRELLSQFPSLFYSAELVIPPLLSMPLFTILWWNLILGAFNLFLPALPLDGGRVLRSLLSFRLGHVRATLLATRVSSIIAIAMFFLGFISMHLILMVIAFFVFFGSREEEKLVLLKDALKGKKLSSLVNKRPLVLKGTMTAEQAFKRMLGRKQTSALVELAKGRHGVLSLGETAGFAESNGKQLRSVLKGVKPLRAAESPGRALERMLTSGERILPVSGSGKRIWAVEAKTLEKAVLLARTASLLKKQAFKKTKKD